MIMTIREYKDYDVSEILDLYSDAGWIAYTRDPDSLRRGYENSLLILAAYEGDELMGLIRVVGDGATVILVQDILVYKRYQRQGVGTALLKEILERFGDVRQIELVTDDTEKTKAFYRSVGFMSLQESGCMGFVKWGEN
ncbi:MAG: GNAT family N-acetyltransferase [Saccharofermentans sp.]|nr:GNAT family N-acetyltransferase [Saccharofermentans sp.]